MRDLICDLQFVQLLFAHKKELQQNIEVTTNPYPFKVLTSYCRDLYNIPIEGRPIASPGDHLSPDYILIDQLCADTRSHEGYCIQGKWAHNYGKEYIRELVEDLALFQEDDRPPLFLWSNFVEAHTEPRMYFVFFFLALSSSVDYSINNRPEWGTAILDDDVAEYLQFLFNSPLMDNGVLFFLSDHGSHFGHHAYNSVFGMAENRHPFLFVVASNDIASSILFMNVHGA